MPTKNKPSGAEREAAIKKLMAELAIGEKSIEENGLLSEEEADRILASETLMAELAKGREAAEKYGWLTLEDVEKEIGLI